MNKYTYEEALQTAERCGNPSLKANKILDDIMKEVIEMINIENGDVRISLTYLTIITASLIDRLIEFPSNGNYCIEQLELALKFKFNKDVKILVDGRKND